MTDTAPQIEWYLARDGQQYGPLSEAEMRAFVDLGHLRDADLIWRPGFDDWRAADQVFALHAAAPPPPPPPVEPQSAPPASVDQMAAVAHQAHQVAMAGFDPLAAPTATNDFAAMELVSPEQLFAAGHASGNVASSPGYFDHQPSVPQPMRDAAVAAPAPKREPLAAERSAETVGARRVRSPASERNARGGRPVREQAPVPAAPADDDLPRQGLGAVRIAAALVFALLIGGAMAAVIKRDQLAKLLPASMASLMNPDRPVGATASAVLIASSGSPEGIDETFQKVPVWQHVKQDFPEWYAERVQEAAKLSAEKRPDGQIAKQLVEALVALRRKHADQALTASPDRLRFVAAAFLDNLKALAKVNVDTCYGFISQGEIFPAVLPMILKSDGSETVQKQAVAVFEAIADGRKTPQNYLPPRKSDYDVLAAELNARGWTDEDLRTFSDPRALGRASPQQVCKMVQDWFSAQIAIKDGDAQLRLLVESLRPVVAG